MKHLIILLEYSKLMVQDLEKRNCLANLIKHQPGIRDTYLYTKDPYELKCQFINKQM